MRWLKFFLFIPIFVFSLENGNPSLPFILYEGILIPDTKPFSFRTSFLIDSLFYQQLNAFSSEVKIEGNRYFSVWTLNIKERVDLYGAFGRTELEITDSNFVNKKGSTFFIGAKAIVLEMSKTRLGFDAKYTKGPISSFRNSLVYFESWQVGGGISQDVSFATPYLGLMFSDTHLRGNNLHSEPNDQYTLFLGLTITNHSYLLVNVEARFFDEQALSGSIEIRF